MVHSLPPPQLAAQGLKQHRAFMTSSALEREKAARAAAAAGAEEGEGDREKDGPAQAASVSLDLLDRWLF